MHWDLSFHADENRERAPRQRSQAAHFSFSRSGERGYPSCSHFAQCSLCAFVMVLCVQCVRTPSHVRWPFVWLAACVYLFVVWARRVCSAPLYQKENRKKSLSLCYTIRHAPSPVGNGGPLIRLALCSIISLAIRASPARFIHLCMTAAHGHERRAAYGRQVQRRRPLD